MKLYMAAFYIINVEIFSNYYGIIEVKQNFAF